jgi:hypothetical protein
LKSILEYQQSNVDSGAGRSTIIIKENDILTGFLAEKGGTTAATSEGFSFALGREDAVEG